LSSESSKRRIEYKKRLRPSRGKDTYGFDITADKTTLCYVSRTIVIGDVHGCSEELNDLLCKVKPTESDKVVLVGDLIGRGPDPRGVLSIVAKCKAVAVQGNHERRLLEVRAAGAENRKSRLGPGHRRMMASFSESDWRVIEGMPLYHDLPEHGLCVVHAGLDPRVALHQQDPWVLTHIRSLDEQGNPSHRDGKESWSVKYQGPTHVVFGHNALRGLQIHRNATGLDSGCVYGGSLSALVLDGGDSVPSATNRREHIVCVPAKRQYFDPNQ
jgi:hypothetical protein